MLFLSVGGTRMALIAARFAEKAPGGGPGAFSMLEPRLRAVSAGGRRERAGRAFMAESSMVPERSAAVVGRRKHLRRTSSGVSIRVAEAPLARSARWPVPPRRRRRGREPRQRAAPALRAA